MDVPKIKNAYACDDRNLIVHFFDGKIKKYDITGLLSKTMFSPLKDPAFFKNVKVETGGYAVFWNANIDISEYELWKNGVDR